MVSSPRLSRCVVGSTGSRTGARRFGGRARGPLEGEAVVWAFRSRPVVHSTGRGDVYRRNDGPETARPRRQWRAVLRSAEWPGIVSGQVAGRWRHSGSVVSAELCPPDLPVRVAGPVETGGPAAVER